MAFISLEGERQSDKKKKRKKGNKNVINKIKKENREMSTSQV